MVDELSSLTAVSPIDGRYHKDTKILSNYFSEYALTKARVEVEVQFLLFFVRKVLKKEIKKSNEKKLIQIIAKFDIKEAKKVKEIEKETNHDVKAVEYYLRQQLQLKKLKYSEFIHIGLTSDDMNSLAQGVLFKAACEEVIFPEIENLIKTLSNMAGKYKDLPMLARTHGQPAVPTTVGKELIVFAVRLQNELKKLKKLPFEAKLSGAVGNFTAHQTIFPKLNWVKLSDQFITSFGLQPNHYTTQIVPAECEVDVFQCLQLINSILIGFNQDMWRYISDEYFVQTPNTKEVGSSTMPQKVNPIHFENSEGNLGIANSFFQYFNSKLPISRLQRDLSDSTVRRNFGSALGHCLLGYKSCLRGLSRVLPKEELIKNELLSHWEVVTEGIQTILRATGDETAYEKLKSFSRGKKINQESIATFIHSLDVDNLTKKKLLALTPLTYLGLTSEIVEEGIKELS